MHVRLAARVCVQRCRGTVGLVHTKCLERWLTESGHTRCELCGYRYTTIRVPRHGVLRSLLIWIKTFVATRQVYALRFHQFIHVLHFIYVLRLYLMSSKWIIRSICLLGDDFGRGYDGNKSIFMSWPSIFCLSFFISRIMDLYKLLNLCIIHYNNYYHSSRMCK